MIMNAMHLRNPPGRGMSTLGDAFSNALCACIISYCVVSFFAGQAGLLAYKDLKSGIVRMNERIGILTEENANLRDMREALVSDSDRMAREARDIGYLRPGEKIVLFSSQAAPAGPLSPRGDMERFKSGSSTGLPDRMIKILAAMTGIAVLLASLLMSAVPKKRTVLRTTADRS
jgi:hypothetical protein